MIYAHFLRSVDDSENRRLTGAKYDGLARVDVDANARTWAGKSRVGEPFELISANT
jgi:hypothetical protein